MGAAAYARGSALIRRQADEAAAPALVRLAGGAPLCWSDERAALLAERAALQEDLRRARRLIGLLRAEKAGLRADLAAAQAQEAVFRATMGRLAHAVQAAGRARARLMAVVRSRLSPEQFRSAMDDVVRDPALTD